MPIANEVPIADTIKEINKADEEMPLPF
jgi:hypothetical protein